MAENDRTGAGGKKRVYAGMQHLILCEGRDAWNFLVTYLNSPALSAAPELSQSIQVEDFGGNEDLPRQLLLWTKIPGFENLKSLTVIRDAEKDAEKAVQTVKNAFLFAWLPVPPSPGTLLRSGTLTTGFVLFPACGTEPINGTLEDLCLDILEEHESRVLREIDGFLRDLGEQNLRTFPHLFKSRLHTYFSVTDAYVSLKIGEAARAGAFDWDSGKLQPLHRFLTSIL